MRGLNRNVPPPIGVLKPMEIPSLECRELPNGIKLHYKDTAHCDLIRFDMVIRAGVVFQSRSLQASLTNLLMKEGCRGMTSAQIAERFDAYGAFVYYSCSMEYASVTLCTPKKYFKETLNLLYDVYSTPTYPQRELEISLAQRMQDYMIGREKVQVVASRRMNELLFGSNHPYGKMVQESDFENFDRQCLLDFHRDYYRTNNTFLVMTGHVEASELSIVEAVFGKNLDTQHEQSLSIDYPAPQPSSEKNVFVPKTESMQAAIRMALPTVGQDHPDFMGLKVMNTALGGYFGSRLMKSIREEKGYTYGIYSSHTVYRNLSYIDIETQTAVQHAQALIECVYEEMHRLGTSPMDNDEWQSLRCYLSGEYARMVDGPFALSDLFISVETIGVDMSFYKRQLDGMNSITVEDIQRLAQTYLQPEHFYVVRVGGKA